MGGVNEKEIQVTVKMFLRIFRRRYSLTYHSRLGLLAIIKKKGVEKRIRKYDRSERDMDKTFDIYSDGLLRLPHLDPEVGGHGTRCNTLAARPMFQQRGLTREGFGSNKKKKP